MKLVVAGSRSIRDEKLIRVRIDRILKYLNITPTEMISGGAHGPDKIGETYASFNNIPLTLMPADWTKNGKAAGPIRNKQMAEYTDIAIVFWDGKSAGTKNMIDNMSKLGKICIVEIVKVDES